MIRTTPPRREGRATSRVLAMVASIGLVAGGLAGCGALSAYAGLLLGGYGDFSDDPDPCASATPSVGAQYGHGSASVVFSDGAAPLTLTLVQGLYQPADANPVSECFDSGTEAAYQDSAGAWMLNVALPANGVATASAPQAIVFLIQQTSSNGAAVESEACQPALRSVTAAAFSGTLTCKRVAWIGISPGGSSSTSSAPFDMTVTFSATP